MNEATVEIPLFTEKDKARFWAKVDKRSENECWEWQASLWKGGYGQIYIPRLGSIGAHRVSWMIHFGEIPKSLCVCHRCDNRKCVNPSHFFLGTHKENMADMAKKGRNTASRNSKLNAANVADILDLHEKGMLMGPIAKIYNVNISSIYRICTGKRKVYASTKKRHPIFEMPLTNRGALCEGC